MRVAICVVLAACGSGSGGGDDEPLPMIEECQLALSLSGAVASTFEPGDGTGCQGALDLGGDPIIAWTPDDDPMVMRLELEFGAESIGVVGEVPGKLGVISPSGFVWDGDCTFQIDYWNETGTKAGGSGTCPPLVAESGPSIVTVEPFEFDML